MKKVIYFIYYYCWKAYDFLAPDMCPQGGHRIKTGLITNVCGTTYCLHRDCLRANIKEIKEKTNIKIDLDF